MRLITDSVEEKNDFLEDINFKNQFKKFYHYQHLLDFLNNYDSNIDVLGIIKEFGTSNYYELFFRGPEALTLYNKYSKTEIANEDIRDLEFYEFDIELNDNTSYRNKIIHNNKILFELNVPVSENTISVQGFKFNNIFYVIREIALSSEKENY